MQGAGGERDARRPGSSRPLPPGGLASAGTSGLHRRWSHGGSSPQPGLAKTCDPNVCPGPGAEAACLAHAPFPEALEGHADFPWIHIYRAPVGHQASTRHGADGMVGNSLYWVLSGRGLCLRGGLVPVTWKRHSSLCPFRRTGGHGIERHQGCVRKPDGHVRTGH